MGRNVLPWICCIMVYHNEFFISQEPLTPLLDSLNKIKHGKTCTSMDMLHNGVPLQICHIAGTTDSTSGFFKQVYSRLNVATLSSLLQLSGRLQLVWHRSIRLTIKERPCIDTRDTDG